MSGGGVLFGVRHFFAGFGFIVRRPSVWPYAAVPMATALVLGLGFSVAGIWGVHRAMVSWFGTDHGPVLTAGLTLVEILADIGAIATAIFFANLLAQPIAGPALDAIGRAVETSRGRTPPSDPPFWESLGRALRVSLATFAIGAPVMALLTLVEFLFAPATVVTWPLKLVFGGFLAAWNFLDYPLAARRLGMRARYAFLRQNLGSCFGFGVCAALSSLVPFVGLFVLPASVAGATSLVVEVESTNAPRP